MPRRDMASLVGVGFIYCCKVEIRWLDFRDYPCDALIHRLAGAIEAHDDGLDFLVNSALCRSVPLFTWAEGFFDVR